MSKVGKKECLYPLIGKVCQLIFEESQIIVLDWRRCFFLLIYISRNIKKKKKASAFSVNIYIKFGRKFILQKSHYQKKN